MFKHILVPLDGSSLAECALPHALAVAQATNARITLLHVLERPKDTGELPTDPLHWHLKKKTREKYLKEISTKLQDTQISLDTVVLEGAPAERITKYVNNNDVDLIALSTHGHSGLSGWNISSVVQKIILRISKSTLLVRAYKSADAQTTKAFPYKNLLVGLDSSPRAEMALPIAINLSLYFRAKLVLGTIIGNPSLFRRLPPSKEDIKLVNLLSERNENAAKYYLEQLATQFSAQDINMHFFLERSDSVISALHSIVEKEKADLVLLTAHGLSSDSRRSYGSVTTSFIIHGTTAVLIIQDLPKDEHHSTQAELASREIKGH